MKLWYIILHSLLGFSSNTAWVLTIICLIISIRALIAPLSWMQMKTARRSMNLNPLIKDIEEEYSNLVTKKYVEEKKQKIKDLRKEHSYSMAAGCLPGLIQLPFFIALYRVIIDIAKPKEDLGSSHENIGFLTSADIDSFLSVRVDGVPLPAHVVMTPEQYAYLGVTQEQVFNYVLPFFVAAAIFTTFNMLHSTLRAQFYMDYSTKIAIKLQHFLWLMVICTPFFPLIGGLSGPLPVAVAYYWVATNIWTFVQTFVFYLILDITMPRTQKAKEYRAKNKKKWKEQKAIKRQIHKNRRRYFLTPWRFSVLRERNRAILQEQRNKFAEKKRHEDMIKKARDQHNPSDIPIKILEKGYAFRLWVWERSNHRGQRPKMPKELASLEDLKRREEANRRLRKIRSSKNRIRAQRLREEEELNKKFK